MSSSAIKSARIRAIPLEAQASIAGRLDVASRRAASAISIAQQAIGLARERRAALISAAVTGKIDVGVAA